MRHGIYKVVVERGWGPETDFTWNTDEKTARHYFALATEGSRDRACLIGPTGMTVMQVERVAS